MGALVPRGSIEQPQTRENRHGNEYGDRGRFGHGACCAKTCGAEHKDEQPDVILDLTRQHTILKDDWGTAKLANARFCGHIGLGFPANQARRMDIIAIIAERKFQEGIGRIRERLSDEPWPENAP